MKRLLLILSGLSFCSLALAQQGPGWRTEDAASYVEAVGAIVRLPAVEGQGFESLAQGAAKAGEASPGGGMMLMSLTGGNDADEITPEIVALAKGLNHDPLQIYHYCKNKIQYEHYFGSKKGATLTYLEGKGNSFDISALMVALLRESAQYNEAIEDVQYCYGPRYLSDVDMALWLGLWYFGDPNVPHPYPHLTDEEFLEEYELEEEELDVERLRFKTLYAQYSLSRGFPMIQAHDELGDNWFIPHVWVRVEINSGVYDMDASFKRLQLPFAGVDLTTATGYSRSTVLSDAGGTGDTNFANYVANLNEAALGTRLGNYTASLGNWFKANEPNLTVAGALGWRRSLPELPASLNALPPVLYGIGVPWLSLTTWDAIPEGWMSTLTLKLGQLPGTTYSTDVINLPALRGRKLALTFNGTTASLHLDDDLLRSVTVANATVDLQLTIDHAHGEYNPANGDWADDGKHDQTETKKYQRGDTYAYAILYGYNASPLLLRQRQEKLDAYRRDGLPDTSRQVVTEVLNIMGLNWLLQTSLSQSVIASQFNVSALHHHRFGRMAQEEGYYVDVGMDFYGDLSLAADENARLAFFQLSALFDSAFEHGLIEQMQGSANPAVSTIKILQLANAQTNVRVYRAHSGNWLSTVKPRLISQGYTTNDWTPIQTEINNGAMVLLPEKPAITLNDWEGGGYAAVSPTRAAMIISGNLSGGFATIPDYVESQPIIDYGYSDSAYWENNSNNFSYASSPLTVERQYAADPVDMATGAFTFEKTDLQLGGAAPRGLAFARSYNSNRRMDDSFGLGYGWTHNLDMSVTERSSLRAGLGETSVYQMAPYLAALVVARDLSVNHTNAKEWQTACLAVKWAVDQLLNNAASVNLGGTTLEFVKLPDGSYVPPAGLTLSLAKVSGNYTLTERNANKYLFNGDKKIASIVDPYGKALTFSYNGTTGKLEQVTDCYSRTLTLTWTDGRISKVADSTSRDVDFAYDGNGDLTGVTDPDEHTAHFEYDDEHRIEVLRNPKNEIIVENIYDDSSRVVEQRSEGSTSKKWKLHYTGYVNIQEDPEGGLTRYFYDDRGRVTNIEDAVGNVDARIYDGQDHLALRFTPKGERWDYVYNADQNLAETIHYLTANATLSALNTYDAQKRLQTVKDFSGNVTGNYTYNTAGGNHTLDVLTIKDANQVTILTNTYDANGNLTSVTDAGNNTVTYSNFNSFGQPQTMTYPGGASETFAYNARGDLTSHTDARGNTTTFTYNKRRLPLVTTLPGNVTLENTYDECGNLASVKDGKNNVTTYTYSPTKKRLTTTLPATDAGTAVVTHVYDSRDWLEKTIAPLGRETRYEYDAAGRLVSTFDALDNETVRDYDGNGRVTSVLDAESHETLFFYDSRGNQRIVNDPLNQFYINDYDANSQRVGLFNRRGKTFSFTYDANQRLHTAKTPLNKTTTNGWNARGLLETVQQPSGNTTTMTYDSRRRLQSTSDPIGNITFGYDNNGNLGNVTTGNLTISRVYDARNRVTSYTDAAGNTVGYGYDNNNNLTSLTYPGNLTVTYAYDTHNKLKTVTDWDSRVTSYAYDLAGRLTETTRPNGTKRVLRYDDADRITRIEERKADGKLFAVSLFTYDNVGKVKTEMIVPGPQPYADGNFTATYDDDNRMATFGNLTVAHDDNGNMVNGPLLSANLSAYAYNARNQLVSAGNVTYTYDAEGNRIGYTTGAGNTSFVVDPNAPLSRVLLRTKPDDSKTFYVYGLGLLYEVDEAEDYKTYHYDYRGSMSYMLAADGQTITDHAEYTPYGMVAHRTGATDTPFLFNGGFGVMTDPNGLLHMRARFYNPYVRRFINADPIGFDGGLNWYAYAGGDPINRVDPFGLDWFDNLSNFAAGFGDAVTFGATRALRDHVFKDFYAGTVNYDSGVYTAGEWSGVVVSTAAGGFAHASTGAVRGATALTRANPQLVGRVGRNVAAGVEKLESSHFIASATLKKAEGVLGQRLTRFLDSTELNRRWLWSSEHYLADPARKLARADMATLGPRLDGIAKWAARTPEWMLGLGYGTAGVTTNEIVNNNWK